MRMRTILVLIVLIAIAVFLWINWPAITAVARFNLFVTTFEAPVGLVMLTLLGVIVATFVAYVALLKSAILLEARRSTRELQAQKVLAERAETSRFIELQELIHTEFARLEGRLTEVQAQMQREIQSGGNAIVATIAELDDRLQRPGDAGPA